MNQSLHLSKKSVIAPWKFGVLILVLWAAPLSAQAEPTLQMADAGASATPHFMSLTPARAGLAAIKDYHPYVHTLGSPAMPNSSNASADSAPAGSGLKGFMPIDRSMVTPLHIVHAGVPMPTRGAISSTLAAGTKPSGSVSAMHTTNVAPTLQLFGIDNGGSANSSMPNFYQALRSAGAGATQVK